MGARRAVMKWLRELKDDLEDPLSYGDWKMDLLIASFCLGMLGLIIIWATK